MNRKRSTKDVISDQTSNIKNFSDFVVFDVSRLCIGSVVIHKGRAMAPECQVACYCWGFDTEYRCSEVSEGIHAEQRVVQGLLNVC